MRVIRPLVAVPMLLAVVLTGTACSPSSPQPVASTTTPRILTMAYSDADANLDPAVGWLVDEVARTSKGALLIQIAYDCCGREYDTAQQLIAGVAKGSWDLGWTQTRDVAEAGAPGVAALTAPFLIDSYAAEKAVLAGDVPATLLPGFEQIGVRGIAVEPGTLRRPIANDRALLQPSDWRGASFWTTRSAVSSAAISALGATPSHVGLDDRDTGLEGGTITGAENAVAWQVASNHVPNAVMSIDEALWPRTSALLADPALRLADQQETWLRSAAAAVAGRTDDLAAFDAGEVTNACAAGYRFATSTTEQRAASERAVAPVVDDIAADPVAAEAITAIRALKPAEQPTEYDVPADCRWR